MPVEPTRSLEMSSVRASSGDWAAGVQEGLSVGDHPAETRGAGGHPRRRASRLSHRRMGGQEGCQGPGQTLPQSEANQVVLGRRGWAGTEQSHEKVKSHH